jgi:hypothetical protein
MPKSLKRKKSFNHYGKNVKKYKRNISGRLWFSNSSFKPEYKYYDTISSSTTTTLPGGGTPQFIFLNDPVVGSEGNQRIGQRINWREINSTFNVTLASLNTANDQFRFLLVQDKQSNGSVFAITDLLQQTTGLQTLVSMQTITASKRFHVWIDKKFTLCNNGTETICLNFYKRFNITTAYFANNNQNVSDVETNSLYWVLMSNNSTNTSYYNMMTRLRYYD